MKPSKHTLVIVAFTTLVSCSSPGVPATIPDASASALRLYATSATLPLVTDLTGAYSGDRQISFETRSGNFRSAFNSLLEGDTAYFISSHLPAPENNAVPLWAAPIGQDGVAIIVNRANPVSNLDLDQLREIYQGRVSNWRSLDGENQALIVFSREEGSDTRAEFERLVMGERKTTLAARLVTSSEAVMSAVAQTPGAVGYVSFAAVQPSVRMLSINGVVPTQTNIAEHLYPLRSTLFVLGQGEPEGAYRAFFGWIQSVEGQRIVARQYVPLGLQTD